VFFYAGHGSPSTAPTICCRSMPTSKSEMDLKLGAAIHVDLTLEQTMSDAKVKLVSRCLPRPIRSRRKSVRPDHPQRQCRDRTCRNEIRRRHADRIRDRPRARPRSMAWRAPKPFTRALIANHRAARRRDPAGDDQGPRPGQRGNSKNQLPWGHTNLIGSVYLNPVGARRRVRWKRRTRPRSRQSAVRCRLEFWRSIPTSRKNSTLSHQFIERTFKSIALARIASLQNGPSTATRT